MICDSTAPNPSPLASVSTTNGILKLGCASIGWLSARFLGPQMPFHTGLSNSTISLSLKTDGVALPIGEIL
ncbi:hypothetical protein T4A_9937 [Trichinella pseudospiralis]|uniref:Uncharacterized protein n=1 Tax=Trichinella pseudospiralis TaxID=6337 RepID=A0A0V1FP39_TRIPS|nr:hypothetical protein T4A_9937 [Trichinella pseudospiralis]KRY84006.1 hypothetical protein T4D_1089 [Trichinella pseudospiralis]KRY87812.1 hypothetical protein T4D_5960 [Trichinella pseudospiralis]KRY89039.1 hypothetical protein T4D_120 [Trichinella pseudospiralis]KRZ44870.1 hypothetical protein T4C_4380 [Trichinella pseudospiralis]